MMKKLGLNSVRNRVLAITLLTSTLVGTMAFFICIKLGEKAFFRVDQFALRERIEDIEKLLKINDNGNYLRFKIKEDWGNRGLQKVFGSVTDENGNEILATPLFPTLVKSKFISTQVKLNKTYTIEDETSLYRVALGKTVALGKSYSIVVAIDRTREKAFFKESKRLAVCFFIGTLILSLIIAHLLTKLLLSPMEKVRLEVLKLHQLPSDYRLKTDIAPHEFKPFIEEINLLLQQLEEVIEKNRRFAADIAHEIRNPIHQARMAIEVALKSSNSISDYKEALIDGLEQMERLSRLVGDMLFLSRVERGLEKLILTELEVRHELEEIIDYYQVAAEEQDQRILLESSGNYNIFVRPELFRRAIGNILENAIRYSDAKAITRVTYATVQNDFIIEIKDEGIGMTADRESEISHASYRNDGSRVFSKFGLGLGLSIARAIMSLHDGRVEIYSSPAKGSTLRLVFPIRSV